MRSATCLLFTIVLFACAEEPDGGVQPMPAYGTIPMHLDEKTNQWERYCEDETLTHEPQFYVCSKGCFTDADCAVPGWPSTAAQCIPEPGTTIAPPLGTGLCWWTCDHPGGLQPYECPAGTECNYAERFGDRPACTYFDH